MVQPLPKGDFKWETETNVEQLIADYADNPSKGCIVKCDLTYPDGLHDGHNDYPLAPERKLVTQDMLSPYAKELQQKLEIGRDTAEKLVPNLQDKEGYVVDIRNLKFYVDHGLQVTKVHSVLSFTQSTWMKPYIDFNTDKRKQAKTDFEKDLFKLMNNSPFLTTNDGAINAGSGDITTSGKITTTGEVECSHIDAAQMVGPTLLNGNFNVGLGLIKSTNDGEILGYARQWRVK
eukprot:COSAG06_NODE_11598_length_1486_cov_25.493151_1_plen_233_part_00